MSKDLNTVFLNDFHIKHKAKLFPFAGYSMPIYYLNGIIKEHLHVRELVGVFDVSHMGQILISNSKHNTSSLEQYVPLNLGKLEFNRSKYSVLLNVNGGIIDDIIISKIIINDNEFFFIVYNADRKTVDNKLFKKILNGAELVAMHKNKYWHSGGELTLDLGAFVSALEFAADKDAVLIGKPSPYLFQLAVKPWKIPFQSIYVVGDDMVGDIGGANNVGMKSVLVKTGKFRKEGVVHLGEKPNYIINSIADLPNLLQLY